MLVIFSNRFKSKNDCNKGKNKVKSYRRRECKITKKEKNDAYACS